MGGNWPNQVIFTPQIWEGWGVNRRFFTPQIWTPWGVNILDLPPIWGVNPRESKKDLPPIWGVNPRFFLRNQISDYQILFRKSCFQALKPDFFSPAASFRNHPAVFLYFIKRVKKHPQNIFAASRRFKHQNDLKIFLVTQRDWIKL
jgi:hypothetical protein